MTKHSLSRLQAFYGDYEATPLLKAMISNEFKGKIALISSFGADSALLIKMVAEVDNTVPVLFLDTGKHFQETLDYVDHIEQTFDLKNLIRLRPDEETLAKVDPEGDMWKSQVNRCCGLRKVVPLQRVLESGEYEAVITGRKRYQTAHRNEIDNVELFEDGVFRVNPLCTWTKDDIRAKFDEWGLPQHPLVAKGYPSIGCEPCTKSVKPGEDERSGRWAHTVDMTGGKKEECGIHTGGGDGSNWMGGGV